MLVPEVDDAFEHMVLLNHIALLSEKFRDQPRKGRSQSSLFPLWLEMVDSRCELYKVIQRKSSWS